MRMTERLRGIKDWAYTTLCEGRSMKAPAENGAIGTIRYQEPKVFLAWAPSRLDKTLTLQTDPSTVMPGIIIMPNHASAKHVEEQRFDRYKGVHRPQDTGQHVNVTMLFGVYEPGIRLPGFVESVGEKGHGLDLTLLKEGTEEGFMTLMDWMDDAIESLLGAKHIPNTDLFLDEASVTYSLYTDQEYVVDRRPLYYGFVNADFGCYADEKGNETIQELLR